MRRVGSAGNTGYSVRPHCAGVNCLSILKFSSPDEPNYLFSGSRDGTLRSWGISEDVATCSATFESHVDWVVGFRAATLHSFLCVHTVSVWALASTPTFSHVYSGGRDHSLYLTRDSLLLCTREDPTLQLALQDDSIWVASTDSSIERWPAEGHSPEKVFQKGGSFYAGNLSFPRAHNSMEDSIPAPLYKEPSFFIQGIPGIVKHETLNNRRHILTKDTTDSVKFWDITRGIVIEDYGKVSFGDKKKAI